MASKLRQALQDVVTRMRSDVTRGRFKPLNEDEVLSRIHDGLNRPEITRRQSINLKARVPGLPGKKVDLVVGEVQYPTSKRPEVIPALAVEVKYCHEAKNAGERSGIGRGVRTDIKKLAKLKSKHEKADCVVVLADSTGRWTGKDRTDDLDELRKMARLKNVLLLDVALPSINTNTKHVRKGTRRPTSGCVYERQYRGKLHTLEKLDENEYLLDGRTRCTSPTDAAKKVTRYENIAGPTWWQQGSLARPKGTARSLTREYRGRTYTLRQMPDGSYLLDNRQHFRSPTAAAKHIVKYSVSGPKWWRMT